MAVVLNQHIHTSFLIRDGEESKSITSLVDEYMAPAMIAQARFVDHVLLGQVYRFLMYSYGRLNNFQDTDAVERLTGLRNLMNINKAPLSNRQVILTPITETAMLRNSDFLDAAFTGDQGSALREASLGRKFGFNFFMCQNTASAAAGNTTLLGAVNLTAGYKAGTTVLTVDGFVGAVVTGSWLTIDTDDVPQRVIAHTETLANTTSITISPGLKRDVLDNAIVRAYTPGTVNNAAGYAKGWAKEITVSGFTVAPQVGQMVTFGTDNDYYCIVATNGLVGITLDRPLNTALTNTEPVEIGPAGQYNFAFLRNALTMVVRPLAIPRQGIGALASVVNLNGLSMRATLTYDGNKQGTLVTLDMLMGVEVLDTHLGAVLLG